MEKRFSLDEHHRKILMYYEEVIAMKQKINRRSVYFLIKFLLALVLGRV